MILRRVIEHVKDQNWFAVGIDFVIVVVGVFVGLQVQDWAATRAQADQQQRYYDRLHADFTAIKTRIEDQFAVFERTIDGAGYVLELVRMPEDEFRDLEIDEQRLMPALTRLTPRRMPPGRSATYVEMLSASQLSAVSNEALRDKLAEYDRQSEIHLEFFRNSADLTNTQIPIVYRHYKVLTTQDESVSSGIRIKVLTYDLEAMRSDPEFETAVMILEIQAGNNFGVRKIEGRLVDEILGLLESEIGP
jgi:hypothetical protein